MAKEQPKWKRIAKGDRLPCWSFIRKMDGTLLPLTTIGGAFSGQDAYYLPVKDVIEIIKDFPKEESEDERIRKHLIKHFSAKSKEKWNGISVKDILAWLEKLGEQKPANSIWHDMTENPEGDENDRTLVVFEDGYSTTSNALLHIGFGTSKSYKWAYVNDILRLTSNTKQSEQKSADKVEPKFKVGDWLVENEPNNYARFIQILEIVDVQGKERYRISRDLHNDEDVAECRFIENNYHSFTIQDAKDGDVLCTYECGKPKIVFILKGVPKKPYVLGYHCYYNIMYPHFEFDSEKGCLAPNEEDVKPATKEQRDLLLQKMKEAGYKWDAEKKELKMIEQKPAWSEEDERISNGICTYLSCSDSPEGFENWVSWLESLKERVQPQPQSDERNRLLGKLEEWLDEYVSNLANVDTATLICSFSNYLDGKLPKSLRPQSQWKPSDEQMRAIEHICDGNYNVDLDILDSIYRDFKKLRK